MLDTKEIATAHMVLFNGMGSQSIKEVTVLFADGAQAAGFLTGTAGQGNVFTLQPHEGAAVRFDLTRIGGLRVLLHNGRVERFGDAQKRDPI